MVSAISVITIIVVVVDMGDRSDLVSVEAVIIIIIDFSDLTVTVEVTVNRRIVLQAPVTDSVTVPDHATTISDRMIPQL